MVYPPRTLKCFINFTIVSVIILVVSLRYFSTGGSFYKRYLLNPQVSKTPIKRSLNFHQEVEDHFRFNWYRERKARADWWGILKPCFHNTDWGQVKPGWEKNQRSDVSMSLIISQEIRPAREYSRLFIQTKTKDGRLKTFGGDSWRVYLRGPASIAATVFDHNNGTYEALFLAMEPGAYRVEAHLDYSLCDGFRDPPRDWFIKGSSHGKYQEEGLLGLLDDFLNQQLPSNLSITIQQPRHTINIQSILVPSSRCDEYCTFLYDGYGRWINGTWAPFLNSTYNSSKAALIKEPTGTIVSYGDSLALRFGDSLSRNPNVGQVYKAATYRYNWIYPVGNEQSEKRKMDDLDFDSDRVVSYVKNTLAQPSVNIEHSTVVLNLGLHFVVSVNFNAFQTLLEKVLDLMFINQTLQSRELQPRYKTNIIWKTTTQIKKENAKWLNETGNRFFTTQRVLLFNAYATWRMCRAGIPVLDVLPVTLSYPIGPMDVVHYPNYVFKQAEDALADFKRFHNNKNNLIEKTCIS